MKKRLITAVIICLCAVLIWLLVRTFFGGSKVVFYTDNYEITEKILDYYIDVEKNEYVEKYKREYGSYFLEAAGLDPEKSLKKQESCYGGTWYDYFKDLAAEKLKDKLLYCEAAKKSDIKPDKTQLDGYAKKFKRLFKDISKSDLSNISEIEALSQAYISDLTDSCAPSKAEKEDYYEKNKSAFDCVDYSRIVIDTGSDAAKDKTEIASLGKKLAASIKKVGFEKTLEIFNVEAKSGLFEVKYEIGYMYEIETQFGSWAFSDDRKSGDAVCFSGRGIDTVYCIKKTAYPADYTIRKIEKITLAADSIGDSINDLYEISDKLTGSKNTTGNLLSYADEAGLTVETVDALKENLSYNLMTWLYDKEHKPGDKTVLEDGYSISFVRYCGESGSYFENRLTDAVVRLKIDDRTKQLRKEIKING